MSHKRLLKERGMLLDKAKMSGPEGVRVYRKDERRIKEENRVLKRKVDRLTA